MSVQSLIRETLGSALSNPTLPPESREVARAVYVSARHDHAVTTVVHRARHRGYVTRYESRLSVRGDAEVVLRRAFAHPAAVRRALVVLEARLAARGSYFRGRGNDFSLHALPLRSSVPLIPAHPLGRIALFHPFAFPGARVRVLVSVPASDGRGLLAVELDPAEGCASTNLLLHHAALPLPLHRSASEHVADAWMDAGARALPNAAAVREASGLHWPDFARALLAAIDAPAPPPPNEDDGYAEEFARYADVLACPFVVSLFDEYLPNPRTRYELRRENPAGVETFIAKERRKHPASSQHHWSMLEAALLGERARIHGETSEERHQGERLRRLLMQSGNRPGLRVEAVA